MSAPWSWMHLVQGTRVFAAPPLPHAPANTHELKTSRAAAVAVWRKFGFETVLLHTSQVAFMPLFFTVLLVLLEWEWFECQLILNKRILFLPPCLHFPETPGLFLNPALPSPTWLPSLSARSQICDNVTLILCLWSDHQMVTAFFLAKPGHSTSWQDTWGRKPYDPWTQWCCVSLSVMVFCEPLSKSFHFPLFHLKSGLCRISSRI